MQENDSPEHSLALLDAELVFGEADKQMREIVREFQHQGYRNFVYDYVDDDDVYRVAQFMPESGIDQNRAVYNVRTADNMYRLAVNRTSALNGSEHRDTEVSSYDPTMKDYVPAGTHEQLQLAEVLRNLDADKIAEAINTDLAELKKKKAPKIGGAAVEAFKAFIGR
jgi:DNA polymerase II large subunit